MPFHLKPGAVIVFEGLDGTGKSTQHERLEAGVYHPSMGIPMFDGTPSFIHMPSGHNVVGEMVYALTESGRKLNPLTRQMLHLAAHAQELTHIRETIAAGEAVFLDRFWWSTVAYGWRGDVKEAFPDIHAFTDLCRWVWRGVVPDVIFAFMHAHVEDEHNDEEVTEIYQWLGRNSFHDRIVWVEPGTEAQQNMQILQEMVRRGIYANGATK